MLSLNFPVDYAIIDVLKKENSEQSGVVARVSFLGSQGMIQGIELKKIKGSSSWSTPYSNDFNSTCMFPVFTGPVMDKLIIAAGEVLDVVKALTTPEWGATYKVFQVVENKKLVMKVEKI